ncbi:DUF3800 domain-containing protein [Methylobacterium sp. E-016]|uniref:DUF3800 domain-containing protein n=1 Tax=Methylobacterium sp. E-016 TaxID=2836556 RepID=UPI001FBBB93E|nr:DUF3800 domain-containing protein [Methylobacterium sp. E-016]MCJ2074485.1 DUF3800 domain-containing protein [Methylobacterium sp. E-016]
MKRGLSAPEPSLGLLVADENKEIEQRLIDDLELYKRGGTSIGWRPTYIGSIVDSIHFVQSANNRLIQCVDLVAYFTLKYQRQNSSLIDEFLAAGSSESWPAWRDAQLRARQKLQAIHEIGQKLDVITVGRKMFL